MKKIALRHSRTLAIGLLLLGLGAQFAGCSKAEEITVSEARIKVIKNQDGHGRPCKDGDVVCIDYRVLLPDGGEIMWAKDFCFELGAGAVIAAIDAAVPGMSAGGKRLVSCPPHMHWGRGGYGSGDTMIPPGTTLSFDIKLTSIE